MHGVVEQFVNRHFVEFNFWFFYALQRLFLSLIYEHDALAPLIDIVLNSR